MTPWRGDEMGEVEMAVAQVMADVEPGEGLEARIKARLDQVPVRQATWSFRLMLAGGAVTAAAAVLIVLRPMVTHEAVQLDNPPIPQSVDPPIRQSVNPPIPQSVNPPIPQSVIPPAPTEAELAWMRRRIPALAVAEALVIEPVPVPSTQPAPLAITPLTMTPIVVSPVSGGVERPQS